ncbi:hypothetical protein CCAN2_2040022 [Capnocytophaga canimorsus]|nr:hypothetical protein CCAN2_2040022 [Capnocytophaga canimorsus]
MIQNWLKPHKSSIKHKNPNVVFGQGIILGQAENELKSFLEKTDIPAAATILGLSALPTEHPNLCRNGRYARQLFGTQCNDQYV